MLEGHSLQKLHHNKTLALMFADLVNGANVRMIQRRCRARLPPEPLQRLRICGHTLGQKFEGHEAPQFDVFGLVDHAHTATAEPLDNAVMRYGHTKHVGRWYVGQRSKVNEWVYSVNQRHRAHATAVQPDTSNAAQK